MYGRAPFTPEQVVFLEHALATSEPPIGSEPQDERDNDNDREGAHQHAEREARHPPAKNATGRRPQRGHLERPEPRNDDNVARSLDRDLGATLDGDVTVAFQRDAGAARREGDLIAGGDVQLRPAQFRRRHRRRHQFIETLLPLMTTSLDPWIVILAPLLMVISPLLFSVMLALPDVKVI